MPEAVERGLERGDEHLGFDGRECRGEREHRHARRPRPLGAVLVPGGRAERIPVRSKREDQARDIDDQQDDRRPETQSVDRVRVRLERSEGRPGPRPPA